MSKEQTELDAGTVRELVATTYGKLVSEESCGCGRDSQDSSCGSRSEAIGYSPEDLSRVPEGAEAPTFGCGNPLAFSEVQEGQTVVDLGSGAGLDLLIAAGKVGASGHVIGVDMTDEMIDRARRNIAAAGHTNVEVRKGLIEELPVESGTVDWVISNCVINLSPEKERVFAEIARVLKPGGRMLVSDIVAKDLPQWIRENAAALGACVGGAISEEEYLAGLRAAGLVEAEVRQRHVFGAAELEGFVDSSEALREALIGEAGCGCSVGEAARRVGEELAGKVASAKVFARKPGADA